MKTLTERPSFSKKSPFRGTGLVAYVTCSYADLVRVFGKPVEGSADGKVRAEWFVQSGATAARIYDYKEDRPLSQLKEWHIGGTSRAAALMVGRALNAKIEMAPVYGK